MIECKRPDLQTQDGGLPYEEAISQHLRNQKEGEIRPLFAYSQLLLALSTNHASYATTGTPKKFWSLWKEDPEQAEAHERRVTQLINQPLTPKLESDFYDWRESADWVRREFSGKGERLPSEQDRTIVSLLDPGRLIELAYQFLVFDGGIKNRPLPTILCGQSHH